MNKRRRLVERVCVDYAEGLAAVIEDDARTREDCADRSKPADEYEDGFVAGLRQAKLIAYGFSKFAAEFIAAAME